MIHKLQYSLDAMSSTAEQEFYQIVDQTFEIRFKKSNPVSDMMHARLTTDGRIEILETGFFYLFFDIYDIIPSDTPNGYIMEQLLYTGESQTDTIVAKYSRRVATNGTPTPSTLSHGSLWYFTKGGIIRLTAYQSPVIGLWSHVIMVYMG